MRDWNLQKTKAPNKAQTWIYRYGADLLIGFFLMVVAIFYGVIGENSYIAVHDNLDLFIPQFQMMKDAGSFFAHDVPSQFLGGISRDVLPSEWSLYTLLYVIFPAFPAYVIGYLLKIVLAVVSFRLLAKDMILHPMSGNAADAAVTTGSANRMSASGAAAGAADDLYDRCRPLILICGFAYGALNLFPMFGIPFATVPLIVYLLRNCYRNPSWKWYLLIFCFPFVSYFSYFGLFILAYLAVAVLWLWIRDGVSRHVPAGRLAGRCRGVFRYLSWPLVLSVVLLSLGCAVFEYRLFATMLLDDTVTIRTSMAQLSLSMGDALKEAFDVLVNGMMHADDAHKFFVMPVCLVYFVFLNARYVVRGNVRGIFRDVFNLGVLLVLFNALIYGLYDTSGLRGLVETLLPPLTGWQFNRTIFFSPFVWYGMLCMVCCRLVGGESWTRLRRTKGADGPTAVLEKAPLSERAVLCRRVLAFVLAFTAAAVVLLYDNRYNDLRHTAYGAYYAARHDGERIDTLNWEEFYSTDLFEQAKADIGYQDGEWAVAYGMYPAVLEYNGISTLDGYLGYYSQDYKDTFRKVIAPALDRMESARINYDDWGARCYLYYGTDVAVDMSTKSLRGLTDTDLYVDLEALRAMNCKYLFSRIKVTGPNVPELIASYEDWEGQEYPLYVYRVQ